MKLYYVKKLTVKEVRDLFMERMESFGGRKYSN